jgi:hypothetical protein
LAPPERVGQHDDRNFLGHDILVAGERAADCGRRSQERKVRRGHGFHQDPLRFSPARHRHSGPLVGRHVLEAR